MKKSIVSQTKKEQEKLEKLALKEKKQQQSQRKRIMAMRASIARDGSDKLTVEDITKAVYDAMLKSCIYCGAIIDFENISCDHRISLAHGGASDISNINFVICKSCNRVKGAFDEPEFLKLLQFADVLGIKKELMLRLKTGIMIWGRKR